MAMNEKIKQIRYISMVILFAFGVGILILTQAVERNNSTGFKEPITLIIWIYLTLVFLYILFLNAIPSIWNYFKKNYNDNKP